MAVDLLILGAMHPPAAPEVVPLERIALAVVGQAVVDLNAAQPRLRVSAEAFVRSGEFDAWCAWTPLNAAAVRARLLGTGRGVVVLSLTEEPDADAGDDVSE